MFPTSVAVVAAVSTGTSWSSSRFVKSEIMFLWGMKPFDFRLRQSIITGCYAYGACNILVYGYTVVNDCFPLIVVGPPRKQHSTLVAGGPRNPSVFLFFLGLCSAHLQ
ncbi:hypothetical protein MVEN_01140100 [Mycena venus]|uniref:Uncharacterized protein n=1 Tax=Mycena venus TaxID=2733690 RepID=A0A8H7D039_9AGAR|nr:hypothetical protein MVEN_01140100 [Mycena venus]